jgi:hypothetical protein
MSAPGAGCTISLPKLRRHRTARAVQFLKIGKLPSLRGSTGKHLSKCLADLSESDDCVAHKNFSIPRIGSHYFHRRSPHLTYAFNQVHRRRVSAGSCLRSS